jgi:hypothetical protein
MQKKSVLLFSAIAALMLMSFKSPSFDLKKDSINRIGKSVVATIEWVKDSHDFGEIPKGIPISTEFTFTNTGDAALVISEVITSCGCTASDYTKEPLMPGKTSKITVTYNAANAGTFSKTITVKSNSQQGAAVLVIKGTVK